MATDTKRFPVSQINRGVSVEIVMREVLLHRYGRAAVGILLILINKRSNGEGPWVELTGVEWRKRTGGAYRKDRGAKALEELGLVKVERDGLKSLRFRLSKRVDPISKQNDFELMKRRKNIGAKVYDGSGLPERVVTREEWAVADAATAASLTPEARAHALAAGDKLLEGIGNATAKH